MHKQTIDDWYEREKASLQRQLDAFESRTLFTAEGIGDDVVDTTIKNMECLREEIADLERVIALCGVSRD